MNSNRAGLLVVTCYCAHSAQPPLRPSTLRKRDAVDRDQQRDRASRGAEGVRPLQCGPGCWQSGGAQRIFLNAPETVRFGPTENLFGYDEISSFRSTRWSAGPPRKLVRMVVTAFGKDVAVTSAVFERADTGALSGKPRPGRVSLRAGASSPPTSAVCPAGEMSIAVVIADPSRSPRGKAHG